jgi:hypothetical protein
MRSWSVLCFLESGGLDVLECRDVLIDECGPVRCGLVRRNKAGVLKVYQRRLELAPSEIDDQRLDPREFARDLQQAGHLLHKIVLVEAMGSGPPYGVGQWPATHG